MICPNCGGEHADWVIKCPYCGSTNDMANEKEYLAHLEQIRKRLDTVDEESEEVYVKGMNSMGKKILILLTVLALISITILTSFRILVRVMERKAEKEAVEQHEWEKKEFPILDELYAKGDYDGIMEEYHRIINEDPGKMVYNWEHFEFCMGYYEKHIYIGKTEEAFAKNEEMDSYCLGDGLYGAIYIYYESTENRLAILLENHDNNRNSGITEEEAELIRQYRIQAKAFLTERMGWNEEEIQKVYEECGGNEGYVSLTKCYNKAKKLLEEKEGVK